MCEMKQIHNFAMKWLDKFRDENIDFLHLFDSNMADDCNALGFKMDYGQAFSEKYVNSADNYEALNKIIKDVTNIYLLGSAIYSMWQYFNNWAHTGQEILKPENREWFIIAFTRLKELTKEKISENSTIILFPKFTELKDEVEKLRTEMSMLVLEKDELVLVECKNIEMAYMLALGNLEYKAFELHCAVQRFKRKMELIQMKKNRQEKVILSAIEQTLDAEFAEYKIRLDEQMNKVNDALERSQCEYLSKEDTKELKMLYRSIVKALHPDLHPDITEAQLSLFHNAVSAYENGDLDSLRIISSMVSEPALLDNKENSMIILAKEKERLSKLLQIIKDKIIEIKNKYPYTMKALVNDKEKISEKKSELEDTISQLKEALKLYKNKIEEMLR